MRLVRDSKPTDYERIRKYVFAQIAKAGETSMRLASTREIAEEFSVSHTTVARVLRDLAAEGFVMVKRGGGGAYTNPAKTNSFPGAKCVGLLFGDGKTTFLPRVQSQLAFRFSDALFGLSRRFQMQNCFISSKLDDAAGEIASLGFDGVLWVCPSDEALPALKAVKALGLAALSVGRFVEGVSSVPFAFDLENYGAAKAMFAKGKRKIVLVPPDAPEDRLLALAGFKKALAEAGLDCGPASVICDDEVARARFAEIVARLRPDGVIFNRGADIYWELLQSVPELAGSCLAYSGSWSVYGDMGFRGLVGVPQLDEPARLAALDLASQLKRAGEAPALVAKIEMQLRSL
jgi:hypothetical protein